MDQKTTPHHKAEDAKDLYRAGEYARAAEAFGAAARAYTGEGDERNAAEMRSNQSVALLQLEEYDRALGAIRSVGEVFAEAGDTRRLAVALSNQAAALEGAGRVEAAAGKYREAADLFEEIGDREKGQQVMQALSALELKSRRPMGAMASMLVGLEQVENPTLFQRVLKKILNIPFRLMDR